MAATAIDLGLLARVAAPALSFGTQSGCRSQFSAGHASEAEQQAEDHPMDATACLNLWADTRFRARLVRIPAGKDSCKCCL